VHPDSDWKCRRIRRRLSLEKDIKEEAILGAFWFDTRLSLCAKCTEIGGVNDFLDIFVLPWLWRHPAEFVDWGSGIPDTFERECPIVS
jgi:hypothetical protein